MTTIDFTRSFPDQKPDQPLTYRFKDASEAFDHFGAAVRSAASFAEFVPCETSFEMKMNDKVLKRVIITSENFI
jgi:hypothetical protein